MGEVEDLYMEKALEIVKEAGFHVAAAFHKQRDGMDAEQKGVAAEVEEVRRKVEELVKQKLEFHFPTHEVIGALGAGEGTVEWDEATPTWVLDPLDGATNFRHRLPLLSICLALRLQKETLVAVVYSPVTKELYTARRGKGAFKNGFRLKSSFEAGLRKALVLESGGAGGWGAESGDASLHNLNALWEARVQGIRWLDAASLSICAVAEGAGDLFLDYGLFCWNMAAAVCVLGEAGGAVGDPSKAVGDFRLMDRRIAAAASPALLHAAQALPFRHIPSPSQAPRPRHLTPTHPARPHFFNLQPISGRLIQHESLAASPPAPATLLYRARSAALSKSSHLESCPLRIGPR